MIARAPHQHRSRRGRQTTRTFRLKVGAAAFSSVPSASNDATDDVICNTVCLFGPSCASQKSTEPPGKVHRAQRERA